MTMKIIIETDDKCEARHALWGETYYYVLWEIVNVKMRNWGKEGADLNKICDDIKEMLESDGLLDYIRNHS